MKIQHIALNPLLSVQSLKNFFRFFAGIGGEAVLLDYNANFPYSGSLASVAASDSYTPAEINELNIAAKECGLEIIPKGISFSHSDVILKRPEFAHLADGSGLNMMMEESIDILAENVRQLAAMHPGSRMIHLGGDEIFGFCQTPETQAYYLQHGKGRLYVDFLCRFLRKMEGTGLTFGIWTDMVIRYPEAIDELPKNLVMFYWDYWNYGDRSGFISIGGGCPDAIVLNRSDLPRDLEKIFRNSNVRSGDEIPVGLMNRYGKYWDISPDGKSARSFPYARYFKDHGFRVVLSCLTYPEKGSFLSIFAEKRSHLNAVKRELDAGNADDVMCCYWNSFWADFPLLDPALAQFMSTLTGKPVPDFGLPECFYHVGNDFEFNDILNWAWGTSDYRVQIDWIRRSGYLEDEIARCQESLRFGAEFLSKYQKEDLFRYTVREVCFRAQLELDLLSGKNTPDALVQLRAFEKEYTDFARDLIAPCDVEPRVRLRFKALHELLEK